MNFKTIEIYYDVAQIRDISDRSEWSLEALAFRNDAMEHIEADMQNANAGQWEGAEIGAGEVNFGFSVEDFDYAEKVVRQSVAGTVFEDIREISRREITQEQLEAHAAAQPHVKPMNFFELIMMLVLRRMPKRFCNLAVQPQNAEQA